jgi:sulfide dehydrogenase cytochrome subunit
MKIGWTAPTLLLLAASAHGQGQEALYVRSLAATCAACHGTDGRVVGDAGVPALAGQSRDTLASRLRAFRAGSRESTVMSQLSKGFNDTQIDQLAGYFSAQKP